MCSTQRERAGHGRQDRPSPTRGGWCTCAVCSAAAIHARRGALGEATSRARAMPPGAQRCRRAGRCCGDASCTSLLRAVINLFQRGVREQRLQQRVGVLLRVERGTRASLPSVPRMMPAMFSMCSAVTRRVSETPPGCTHGTGKLCARGSVTNSAMRGGLGQAENAGPRWCQARRPECLRIA